LLALGLAFHAGTSIWISYPDLKGLTIWKDTVRVRPVAPTLYEFGINYATCIRAGVIPVINPSYLTALAFPDLSTKKACNRGISCVVEGLMKFPI